MSLSLPSNTGSASVAPDHKTGLVIPEAWTPEPITAWRVWLSSTDPLLLKSITASTFWTRAMPAATCMPWAIIPGRDKHQAPEPGCQCGYWAVKPELLAQPETWSAITWEPQSVIHIGALGWVEQWGTVDEYEYGYRSQYAKITSLIDLDESWSQHLPEYAHYRLDEYRRRVKAHAENLHIPVVPIG